MLAPYRRPLLHRILPAPLRRGLVDLLFGEGSAWWFFAYRWGLIGGGWLVMAALLLHVSIFDWPVRSGVPVTVAMPSTCQDYQQQNCDSAQLVAAANYVNALTAQLRDLRGNAGPAPPALLGGAVKRQVDQRVCRMEGVAARDRGALAWHVSHGAGGCSWIERRVATFPLSVWLGYWPGLILSLLIVVIVAIPAYIHFRRLPATRRMYWRLYGSEHRAS